MSKVQTHKHTTTCDKDMECRKSHEHTTACKKKKSKATCRFGAPWEPSIETCIIRGQNTVKEDWKKSKEILDKVLGEMATIPDEDLHEVELDKLLDSCGVTYEQYNVALEHSKQKLSLIYKRRPAEKCISPYNPILLNSLKSNMNLQFVTGVYGLLSYLTSYLCKPERT